LPDDPIGGRSQLRQTQSFHKLSPDASLSFTVSAAFIETTDRNAVLARPCPPAHADGLFCDLVKGELFLDVQAFTVPAAPDIIPFDTFLHVAGGATVSGFALNWNSDAWTTHYSQLLRLHRLAEGVAVTDDGKILVAGQARDNVDGYGVARLSPQDTGPTGS
jgi:hypothetical protein